MIIDFHDEETLKVWQREFSPDSGGCATQVADAAQCTANLGFTHSAQQPAGNAKRQARRSVEHTHQRPMASVF